MPEFIFGHPIIEFADEFFGFVIATALAIAGAMLRPKAKLTYGQANNSVNTVFSADDSGENPQAHQVYVEVFFINNVGKKAATNVELVFASRPSDIRLFPPTAVKTERLHHGEWLVIIPQISPQELLVVNCMYINLLRAELLSVKSAETIGKEVDFHTVRQFGPVFNYTVVSLMFLGAVFLISTIIRFSFSF